MKSISAIDKHTAPALQATIWDALAKKILLHMLQRIQVGHLTLEQGGQVHCFGQNANQAEVIAHISITHTSAYRYFLLGGSIGAAESYMLRGWWSPDLQQVMRLMALNMHFVEALDSRWSLVGKFTNAISHRLRANNKNGARRNIAAHYDLGNDFFALFLDPTMLYSAAIYPQPKATLHQASLYKLEHICQRLQLTAADHLLEVGTGWGGLAVYAAKHYGCKVTTVTISKEQHAYAQAWVNKEGLGDQVEVLLQDYRDIQGRYDKLVSIEMIEAVGYRYYREYFACCSALLKADGLMFIQAITIADQRYHAERDNVDFIQKYIFPGGCLPSVEVVSRHVAQYTDMQVVGLQDITAHYAQTLADWRVAFLAKLDEVKKQGFDEVFIRMWEFYLCYCEGGFRERVISTVQVLMAKPQFRQLPEVVH